MLKSFHNRATVPMHLTNDFSLLQMLLISKTLSRAKENTILYSWLERHCSHSSRDEHTHAHTLMVYFRYTMVLITTEVPEQYCPYAGRCPDTDLLVPPVRKLVKFSPVYTRWWSFRHYGGLQMFWRRMQLAKDSIMGLEVMQDSTKGIVTDIRIIFSCFKHSWFCG